MTNQRVKMNSFDKTVDSRQRLKQHFSMESSIGHLMEVAKNFYFVSIGIDHIQNDAYKSNRIYGSILHLIYFGIFTFFLDLFSFSNYFYNLIKLDFLPSYFRINMSVYAIGFTWILGAKIDMFLAETKSNLTSWKVFYFLMNNIKSKHKLSDLHYNQLAISSRMILIGVLDYGTSIMEMIAIGLIVLVAIVSHSFVWILSSIYFTPALLIACVNFSCWICSVFILVQYYKLRYDQIHSEIKSILPENGQQNVINIRIEKLMLKLIGEHKVISNEIEKLNRMLRRAAGGLAIFLITDRIIVLYLLISFKNNIFVIVMLLCQFLLLFIFGFAITFLCSQQIKSAHQSYKLIQSILFRFDMRLPFKRKVH